MEMENPVAVRTLFVGKRPELDSRSAATRENLNQLLQRDAVRDVRVVRRYVVENVDDGVWERALQGILVDPAGEKVMDAAVIEAAVIEGAVIEGASAEGATTRAAAFAVGVSFLPGQFDHRAHAAEQVFHLLGSPDAIVTVAEFFLCSGAFTGTDVADIRRILINPVDSCEIALGSDRQDSPQTTDDSGIPADTQELGMNGEDREYVFRHFRNTEQRDPTETELRVLATYWSDHCRHTTFRTELTDISIPVTSPEYRSYQTYLHLREVLHQNSKPKTLMDLATIVMRWRLNEGSLPDLVVTEEVNACTIRVGSTLVLFKNETHNHPTEIEPFGGAATCLGGAIRDPLSGRAYVYQAMRVTGSADPRPGETPTLPGKLPQFTITRGAADGYSSYGNQVGIATGMVEELYHPGYAAKRLEIGAVIGSVPEERVRREEPEPGDLVILLGGRTGRDGIGGATGSSKSHTTDSVGTAGAEVQKGNPTEERALQRLFLRPDVTTRIKRANDFGAGGISVAVGEIAPALDIFLDDVPLKYRDLTGTEVAISESQERMAIVVAPEDRDPIIEAARAENTEATVVAQVTDTGRLRMFSGGECVVDLDRAFLDSAGVRASTTAIVPASSVSGPASSSGSPADNPAGTFNGDGAPVFSRWRDLIGSPAFASRRGLAERFDATIGAGTVLLPYGGRYQLSPAEAMVATLPDSRIVSAMSFGFDPGISSASPYHGAYIAVLESVARLVAAGFDPARTWLTLQEYFPAPNDDPRRWGLPVAALLGAFQAQMDLGVTAVGGKDSMSGSFEDLDVPPTLVSFAVATGEQEQVVASVLSRPGSVLVLLSGSTDDRALPDHREFMENAQIIKELREANHLRSCRSVRSGGWAVALMRSCFGNALGVELETGIDLTLSTDSDYGGFLLELPGDEIAEDLLQMPGVTKIGYVIAEPVIRRGGDSLALSDLVGRWDAGLESVFPQRDQCGGFPAAGAPLSVMGGPPAAAGVPLSAGGRSSSAGAPPAVLIPVFPGTNCEIDSARAWERAGATVQTLVLQTRSAAALEESIETMARMMEQAQILMIPGGFSAADEPGGSGRYIAAFLQSGPVRNAIERFFLDSDRLILGICNGFQALVHTGLVPFGEYRPRTSASPVLGPNAIGRHVSRHVIVRVCGGGRSAAPAAQDSPPAGGPEAQGAALATAVSPWLAQAHDGLIESVPVSHGEGRFICSPELLLDLQQNGQIAGRYADYDGTVRDDRPWNPNGSTAGIEGLLSSDGRFYGRMGHSERVVPGLYRTVPQIGSAAIFDAAVSWFG